MIKKLTYNYVYMNIKILRNKPMSKLIKEDIIQREEDCDLLYSFHFVHKYKE